MTDIIVKDIKNGSEYYYGGSAEVSAEDVSYDNSSSGATATNVQDAIDEVASRISSITGNSDNYNVQVTSWSATLPEDGCYDIYVLNDSSVHTKDIKVNDTVIKTLDAHAHNGYYYGHIFLFNGKQGDVVTMVYGNGSDVLSVKKMPGMISYSLYYN